MKIEQAYFKFINRFNILFSSLKAGNTNSIPLNFQHFTEQENFGLTDYELKSETKVIDDVLFVKIYDYLLFCKQKLLFLLGYKKSFYDELSQKNEELIALNTKLTNTYDNNIGNNVLTSMYLKASHSNIFSYDFIFKNGFTLNNNKIFPIFKKMDKLEYDLTSYSGKLNVKFNNNVYLSMINLVFSRELNDQIIISYKTKDSTETKFYSSVITLSKNKFISLGFENCSEINISSNVNFNEFLSSLICFGGFENTEYAQGYGVLKLDSEDTIEKFIIESDPELFFYKVNKNVFSTLQTTNSYYDFENHNSFTKIEANLFQNMIITADEVIVVAFDTNKAVINEPLIYGSVANVD